MAPAILRAVTDLVAIRERTQAAEESPTLTISALSEREGTTRSTFKVALYDGRGLDAARLAADLRSV